ncbi:MAG TPA: phosphatidate cytidylyltransferase, partial [Actinomycetota bacterium]|nr:phosphatidate cytidylyltransferase [Actinomycetota bacterium]
MTESAEKSGPVDPSQVAPDEQQPGSKAGRNLPVAIGVGVGLGLLCLVSLFTYKWLFAIVALIAIWIGIRELTTAFALGGIKVARTPLYVGAAAMVPMAYVFGIVGQLMIYGLI